MKYNSSSIILLLSSLILMVVTLLMQKYLTIFSFLLLFYLLPMMLFSIGFSLLKQEKLSPLCKAGLGGVIFTFIYTMIFYANVVDFRFLIESTHIEGISMESVNMDLSSVVYTFITATILVLVNHFLIDRIKNVKEQFSVY